MKKQKLTIMWCLLCIVFILCFVAVQDVDKTTTLELVFISLSSACSFMIGVNLFGGKKYE